MDHPFIWWNHISGASRYLHDTLAAAAEHRVLLLEEAPYMETFLRSLQEGLRQWDSNIRFEMEMADEWTNGANIDHALLERFAPHSEYHPIDGSRIKFMARQNILEGKVLIIRQSGRLAEWVSMAVEYAKFSGSRNGLLLIIYDGESPLASPRRGVAVLKWERYISSYDMLLFASYCLGGEPGLSAALRHYITQLASRLAGTDPRLCSVLATKELIADTDSFLQRLAAEEEIPVRWFADKQLLESATWEAQIQTVFPLIERLRRHFIESYYDDLAKVLPRQDEFGKVLETPPNMELRHMWYYYFKTAGFRHSEDEQTFRLVYNARNELVHLHPLPGHIASEILLLDERRPIPAATLAR